MKKGTFKIKKRTENGGWTFEEVKGFFSDNFGVFKAEDLGFSVTHLKTGLRLALFQYLRQAKYFVKEIESVEFPVAWDSSSRGEDYRPNANKALVIMREVRKCVFS